MKRAEEPASGAEVRIVARIIDPSVREDGFGEPVFVAHPVRSQAAERAASPGAHPVRERLLAKARALETARMAAPVDAEPPEPAPEESANESASPAPNPDAVSERLGFSAQPELLDDLDLIGAPERPRAAARVRSRPLNAPAALLLGTLSGMALLALAFSILIQIAPRPPLGTVLDAEQAREQEPAALRPEGEGEGEPAEALASRIVRPSRKRVAGPWRIADALAAGEEQGARSVEGAIGDQSFLNALQAKGVSLREGYRVISALRGLRDLDKCRPRHRFHALLDASSGRLRALEYTVSDEEVYQAREGPDDRLVGQRLDLQVRRERSQGVLVVRGTFEDSAIAAGFEPGLASVVNKALAGYASVGEMRDGDVLGLVVQEVSVLGEFSRYAGVEALEYRALGAEPLRIYYHQSGKSRGYVDSKGRVFGKSRWARPVPGAARTSRFNPKRRHPILKVIKPHNGTDFGAPTGTPVLAAAAGRVTFVGEAGPNGNLVTVRHTGGYDTGYSHLSRFAKGLKVGSRVEQKQLVGYVGSTGRSTGPHLHFSAKKNGRFIDPESLNLDAFARVAVSDRHVLAELRGRYDRLLNALNIPEPRALESAPAVATGLDGLLPAPSGASARALDVRSLSLTASAPPSSPGVASLAAIYLSDQELMRQQPAVHAGEVDP